ncbi:MAG: acyl-CoA synthetase [Pseudomonadota bacterium]
MAVDNFGDLLDAIAARIPERPAIVCGELTRSWAEFDARSNRLARRLLAAGLAPDSKVAFYLRNSPAYLELMSACFKARLVHANVNYLYVNEELHHVLANSDAEAVVYDAEFGSNVEALLPRLPKVALRLEVGAPESDSKGAASFESACTAGDAAPLEIERSGDDLYFMYTGGTTGYPKAVMWPQRERVRILELSSAASPADHARHVAETTEPVSLPAAPLMHSTGFTAAISALMAGGCVALLPSRSFDARLCLAEIERLRVARMAIVGDAFAVPLLDALAQQPCDTTSVRLISSAGAMFSADRKLALLEYFPNAQISDSLGSSEGSRLGSRVSARGDAIETARFKLGKNVKVFTEDFREVRPGSGESGRIATSGAIPLGYYKDPERTAATFPVIDGVRYSMAGDWCRVLEDGTLELLGRGNNCINSGGEKIYPEEVEEALKLYPEITDAAVIGVDDPRWGQAVTAVVHTRDGVEPDADELKAHLLTRIARYKHPKSIHVVQGALRHDNGKVNYRGVRRLLEHWLPEQ